ncbi:hypothetical protein KC325_g10 [Hortaea werneckii]|nr:hypothetical protein KC325_g10 [Hortaea werneckii]
MPRAAHLLDRPIETVLATGVSVLFCRDTCSSFSSSSSISSPIPRLSVASVREMSSVFEQIKARTLLHVVLGDGSSSCIAVVYTRQVDNDCASRQSIRFGIYFDYFDERPDSNSRFGLVILLPFLSSFSVPFSLLST